MEIKLSPEAVRLYHLIINEIPASYEPNDEVSPEVVGKPTLKERIDLRELPEGAIAVLIGKHRAAYYRIKREGDRVHIWGRGIWERGVNAKGLVGPLESVISILSKQEGKFEKGVMLKDHPVCMPYFRYNEDGTAEKPEGLWVADVVAVGVYE